MVTCNVFELILTVIGGDRPSVEYSLHTDLPAGTQVILSCERTYEDKRGSLSVWGGYDEMLNLMSSVQNGFSGYRGVIDVVESDKQALDLFRQINRCLTPSGIKSPIGDIFTVRLTVGARQRLREFGKYNAKLSGLMVFDSGGINVIRVSRDFLLPMSPEFQPVIGSPEWDDDEEFRSSTERDDDEAFED